MFFISVMNKILRHKVALSASNTATLLMYVEFSYILQL